MFFKIFLYYVGEVKKKKRFIVVGFFFGEVRVGRCFDLNGCDFLSL